MADKQDENEIMEKAWMLYKQNHSLQKTADEMRVAYGKIRKMLITLGEYQTPFTVRVLELRKKGLEISEIAQEVGCSKKKVTAYLPYEKGVYNVPEPSFDAKKSKCYRRRIDTAARNIVSRKYKSSHEDMDKKGGKQHMGTRQSIKNKKIYPVRLHLELMNEVFRDEEKQILMKYADATERGTLTRDIMIPSDMPLHNLHYAIQRLFGWQNSHLRSFHLPHQDYERLTKGSVQGWLDLVGILFQGWPKNRSAQFWDEDYRGGSFKTWLKKKYTGPYFLGGSAENYEAAKESVIDFIERFPQLEVRESFHEYSERTKGQKNGTDEPMRVLKKAPTLDLTLEELHQSIIIEEGTDKLLERLEVISVLALPGEKLADSKALGQSLINPVYLENAGVYFGKMEPEVFPVAHTLLYNYDYGDNWLVEISRRKECSDLLNSGAITEASLNTAEQVVMETHRPVCISKKGAYVMDDVGGMHGYADFLAVIHESDDKEEKQEHLTWAEGLGWSRRKSALDKML